MYGRDRGGQAHAPAAGCPAPKLVTLSRNPNCPAYQARGFVATQEAKMVAPRLDHAE